MKYARFEHNGIIRDGIIEENVISPLMGGFFQDTVLLKENIKVRDVRLLAPVKPSKIIATGLNYVDHAEELKMPIPKEPLIFLKAPTSVIGQGDTIWLPSESTRVDYEAELAIIIKKGGRNIPFGKAHEYIFGYTCLNDVTARDLQKKDGQWARAKSFDTFCPIGPCIATDIDVSSLMIETRLNGIIKQASNTSRMIFSCKKLVEFISKIMTLEPGDIIATGTPAGIGPMIPGDEVEIKIEKIGSLINRVAKK